MKKLLSILLIITCINSYATTTYFVSLAGSDGNNGTSTSTPFKTSARALTVAVPGDIISMRGGDNFPPIIVNKNGTSGNPITFNSYGTGQANVTGFTPVTAWTNLSANIWESTAAVSTLTTCNMIVINGVNIPMGRFPQSSFLSFQSHVGLTSITSSSLNSATQNWTGATSVIRTRNSSWDKGNITAQAGSKLTYTASANSIAPSADNFGFLIENDVRTLTYQNAWYYNPATKKLRIFSTTSPTNVQVPTQDILVTEHGNFITFSNINFTGANSYGFNSTFAGEHDLTISNCNISFIGIDGVNLSGMAHFTITGGSITETNDDGINFVGATCPYPTITGTRFHNIGMFVGMGQSATEAYTAIDAQQTGALISNCSVIRAGYSGIKFGKDSSLVQNNLIDTVCFVMDDGGCIYTQAQTGTFTFRRILNNICLHALGAPAGTNSATYIPAEGIYLDDNSMNIEVAGNTCAFNANHGIFYHNAYNINLHDNTVYNNGIQWGTQRDAALHAITGCTTLNNLLVSATAGQQTAYFLSSATDVPGIGTFNFDSYCRPIDDNLTITTQTFVGSTGTTTKRTLAMLQAYLGQEAAATKSPLTITNVNQLLFLYNPAGHDSTVSIPGNYIDMRSVTYPGTITLHTFTSAVLINTGTNIPPVANAGLDKNITLPTASVSLTGSGTDADGTVVAYNWTQLSGPAATIGSPTSATTLITTTGGAGTYTFQLQVRDNLGATGIDQMMLVVNASAPPNQPPVVDAGGNKSITLPTSSTTQVGNATDPDGTIASVHWTQSVGNPIPATFGSPNSTTTTITGMSVGGPYQFTLTATDNLGATGSKTVTITVNIPPNQNPVAIAGSDQVLTWPVNSTTLNGSGTDADGSIVAYNWLKLSGTGTVTSPTSATTTITGLDLGISQFQLQVIDNSGGVGLDTVQITENQGSASLSFTVLSVTYNGALQLPSVVTSPAGLPVNITLNGLSGGASQANSYAALAGINDIHWTFTPISGTFTINKATTVITAFDSTVNFDGLQHSITGTTTPNVTGLSATYTGISGTTYGPSATPPSAVGTYRVDFILTNTNWSATPISKTLTIVSNPEIIFISDTLKIFTGFTQAVTVTTAFTHSTLYNGSSTPPINAGTTTVISTITQVGHSGADTAIETILKATPILGWTQPQKIPFGAQLTALILNPTSNWPGHFTFNYPLGTVLPIGPTIVTGTFVPDDPANVNGGSISVTVNVFGVDQFLPYIITGPGGQILFIKQ